MPPPWYPGQRSLSPAPPCRTRFLPQLAVLRGATLLLWMQTMYCNCFPRFSPNQLQKEKAHLEIRSGPHRNIQGFSTKNIICVCTHMWTPLCYGKNTKWWGGGFISLSPRWLKTTWRHPHNVSWMLRYAAGPMASGASHQPELPGQLPLPASCTHPLWQRCSGYSPCILCERIATFSHLWCKSLTVTCKCSASCIYSSNGKNRPEMLNILTTALISQTSVSI